jgi:hypothetical protein
MLREKLAHLCMPCCECLLLTSHTDRLILCTLLPSLLMVWKMSFSARGTSPGLSEVPCSAHTEVKGRHSTPSFSA